MELIVIGVIAGFVGAFFVKKRNDQALLAIRDNDPAGIPKIDLNKYRKLGISEEEMLCRLENDINGFLSNPVSAFFLVFFMCLLPVIPRFFF